MALALPSLGVLAAEPLYLLFDTAVVGRLGALALAGLAHSLCCGWCSSASVRSPGSGPYRAPVSESEPVPA